MSTLRHALRGLAVRPGVAAVAIVTMAIGIGAVVTIFSLVDAVLLRPLPYPDPDGIVVPWEFNREVQQRLGFDRLPSSPADVTDYRVRNSTFAHLASMRGERVNLTGDGPPERLGGVRVSVEFFAVLGVSPIAGRTFVADDRRETRAIVIAEPLWRSRFASDAAIVGRTTSVNGEVATIVGVLPAWFRFPSAGDLPEGFGFSGDPLVWTLDVFTPRQEANRGGKSYALIGRLGPGVTAAMAESDLARIADDIARESPQSNAGWTVRVISLREQLVGAIRPSLLVLLTAVGLVLLIACGNVANLLLVHAASRQHDISVRYALGAVRHKMILDLLTESVLLSVVAGMFGVAVAWWGLRTLLTVLPTSLPSLMNAGFGLRVLGVALGISLVAGVIVGLVPALQVTRGDVMDGLREGGRGTIGGRRTRRIRDGLVIGEVALAVLLLIGTALLIQAFVRLTSVPAGFRSGGVVTAEIALPRLTYSVPQRAPFFESLLDRVSALPGVEAAGVTSGLPLSGSETLLPVFVEGRPRPDPGQETISDYRVVTPGYFKAMAIPLVDGETLPERPDAGGVLAMVINETMARIGWPGGRAIGSRIRLGLLATDAWHTVIGVVGDTKQTGLDQPARPQVYVHQRDNPSDQMTVVLLTSSNPSQLAAPMRSAVLQIDPNQPVGRMRAMEEVVASSVSSRRFYMLLAGVFSLVALALSLVGLYAVVSCSVAQRIPEMALRLALGAQPRTLLLLVLSEGLKLAGTGVVLGLICAVGLTRFLEQLLFGVKPLDLPTFVLVPIVLFGVALLGCVIPALRATRVDPATALRSE